MNNGFEIQFESLVYTGNAQTVSVKVTRDLGAPSDTRYVTFNGEKKELEFESNSATVEFSVSAAGDYKWSLGTANDPDNDGSGVYTLAVSTVDTDTSWKNAEAVVTDLDGKELKPEADGTYELPYTGEAQRVLIGSITPEGAEALTPDDFEVTYSEDDVRDIVEAGTYTATAKVTKEGSVYNGETFTVTFKIVDELTDVTAFIDADGDEVLDEGEADIVYNGSDQSSDIAFAVDGKKVAASATFYYANGASASSDVKNAGDYKAIVTVDGKKATVDFSVAVLDLSKANVTVSADLDDSTAAYTDIAAAIKINGKAASSIADVALSADIVDGNVGSYSATVSAAKDSENVTGSKKVSFNVVEEVVTSGYSYGETPLNEGSLMTFDATSSDKNLREFDKDAISVAGVDPENVVVTVTDSKGNVVSAPAADGTTYTVTVAVVTDDYSKGGKLSFKVKQINGTLSAATATVTYNGEVVSAVSHGYDGTDAMDAVKVAVKSGKETLKEGTDYELVLTKAGKEVDGAVDAGNYVLTIKGLAFDGSIAVPVTVNKAVIEAISVQGYAGAGTEVAYTGETVVPTVLYTLDKDAEEVDWKVLPADEYFLSNFKKDSKSIKAEDVVETGSYTADIAATSKMKNFDFASDVAGAGKVSFEIAKKVAFSDVPVDAWYAEVVAQASSADFKYMNGIEGTTFFAPLNNTTRAEVAQVFFNMAGAPAADASDSTTSDFEDVSDGSWYNKSVRWASALGIVTGYSDTGLFGPDDNASREQVATMIYRYMKALGEDVSVSDEAAALAEYADGASVSDWAKTAMAWCVEKGVFGVDVDTLRPQDNMSRAEMAATAVRVQPEGALGA